MQVPRPFPTRPSDIAAWVRSLRLTATQEQTLIDGIDALLARERASWERSRMQAVGGDLLDLTTALGRLLETAPEHQASIGHITQRFERIVAELTDRASRDPKTQLITFPRFLDQLAVHLASEQRGRWCAVGFVDIRAFKWYNDTFGHALGDRILERVARVLREQVRPNDVIAYQQSEDISRDLHARFGGDEFCFLIPQIDGTDAAATIAARFRTAVERQDWAAMHPQLAGRPVSVDVGVACLLLGPIEERRHLGPALAQELLMYADKLMYRAKAEQATRPYPIALCIENGSLAVKEDDAPRLARPSSG